MYKVRNLKGWMRKWASGRGGRAAIFALLAGSLPAARGQDAVRMSIASAQAAEAQRRAAATVGYYNLQLGPTYWNFGTGLGAQYNSNINLTDTDRESDLIFTPQINTRMLWPVSDQNGLNLTLGAGYSAYVQNANLDRAFITPGSALSFDLYIGDFWINLHDRFSILENPYQDPTVAGSGNYSQFQNAAGVSTVWDLNKVVLKSAYDHVDSVPINGSQGQSTLSEEVFSLWAGYTLEPKVLLGLAGGASVVNEGNTSTVTGLENGVQWNVGPFFEAQASEYIQVSVNAGYTEFVPGSGGNVSSSDLSGGYAQASITHRLNQYVSYSLAGGRILSFSLYGTASDMYFANLGATWNLIHKVSLGTSFSFYHGTPTSSYNETFDQYGPQVTLSRPLTAKLSSSLSYQFYLRDSNQANRSYSVSLVTLNLNYTF
jgi:hypothetical protein